MYWVILPLAALFGLLLFERRRRARLPERLIPEERELYLDQLDRKRTAEMKKQKVDP